MIARSSLPPAYSEATEHRLKERIRTARQQLGRRLVILGHHYQQDEVIAFADFTGDSLKLAQLAAQQTEAEYIVFCGVHFMAESADILTSARQTVILPDMSAGCSMADMADIDDVEEAWGFLSEHAGLPITPITYVNSAAAVKAFVGRHDGACCTSGNAKAVLEWALHEAQPPVAAGLRAGRSDADQASPKPAGHKVLFLPDQHLGRNTAYALGWPLDSMVVYDPHERNGGLTPEQVRAARFILWKGHCSVHQLFTVEQTEAVRALSEPWRIIVHPECKWEVCQRADEVGSTEYIIKVVTAAEPGTYWAIGTELHLVNRLAATLQDRQIHSLAGIQCLCSTMYRIDLPHLCWTLEGLVAGEVVNQVRVDEQTARWSRVALDRMLELRPAGPVSAR